MVHWLLRIAAILIGLAVLGGGWLWVALRPPDLPAPAASGLTLADVTVITPGLERRSGQSLVVRDGRIAQLGPGTEGGLRRYAGRYVLPGLIDMHTHFPPATPLRLSGYFCLLYLAHGVTTVRDAGDTDGTGVPAVRQGIRAGDFPGPRIYSCGPFVVGAPSRWANSIQMDGPEEADAVVARLAKLGVDCVKSYDDLDAAEIDALKAVAARRGLHVIGHVPYGLTYEEALLPEVQHLLGVPETASLRGNHIVGRMIDWQDVDEARLQQIVDTTLAHGIINTPTLVAGDQLRLYADYPSAIRTPEAQLMPGLYYKVVWDPEIGLPFYRHLTATDMARAADAVSKKKELVGRLWQAGARLLLGTDVQQPLVTPGISLQQEMRLFVEAGIPTERVWEIATWRAAELLDLPGLGTLREGAPADLLIFRRDPVHDLAALDSLEAVVVRGQLYPHSELMAAVERHQEHFAGFGFDRLSVAVSRRIMSRVVQRSY